LIECVLRGVDILPIVRDRTAVGANWLRVLSQKNNNTGWSLNPRIAGHRDAVRKTLEILGGQDVFCELVVFADTLALMPDPAEQQGYWGELCAIAAEYPHCPLELINEAGHATQKCDPSKFRRAEGVLCSHGSGLSDVQPVKPFWDYATYHARRSGSIGKILSNYSPYVFQDTFPTPVPFVPEETVKPQQYGFDPRVASAMARHARCGAGGTFHGDWWNEPRLFNDGERACAEAFYAALS